MEEDLGVSDIWHTWYLEVIGVEMVVVFSFPFCILTFLSPFIARVVFLFTFLVTLLDISFFSPTVHVFLSNSLIRTPTHIYPPICTFCILYPFYLEALSTKTIALIAWHGMA